MLLLQEYHDFLIKNGYVLEDQGFLNGCLLDLNYKKDNKYINLTVIETEEFSNYLKEIQDDIPYEIDYKDYIVTSALIKSSICNKTGFMDNSKEGIILVKEPDEYYIHGLNLFEYCVLMNGAEHESKILKAHIENLKFFKKEVIPLLKEADYEFEYSSIFDIKESRQKDSSNFILTYKHPNAGMESFFMETDCLTGEPIIEGGKIDPHSDILTQLREKIWKGSLKYSYLLPNHDPKDTKETYNLLMNMFEILRDSVEGREIISDFITIDSNKIPDKYQKDLEKYNNLKSKYEAK